MSGIPVTEAELHAYVDGVLPASRSDAMAAHLADHPEDAARVAAYREQIAALRREYDPVLSEPVPQQIGRPSCRERV